MLIALIVLLVFCLGVCLLVGLRARSTSLPKPHERLWCAQCQTEVPVHIVGQVGARGSLRCDVCQNVLL
jgi:hypothetical protein